LSSPVFRTALDASLESLVMIDTARVSMVEVTIEGETTAIQDRLRSTGTNFVVGEKFGTVDV